MKKLYRKISLPLALTFFLSCSGDRGVNIDLCIDPGGQTGSLVVDNPSKPDLVFLFNNLPASVNMELKAVRDERREIVDMVFRINGKITKPDSKRQVNLEKNPHEKFLALAHCTNSLDPI